MPFASSSGIESRSFVLRSGKAANAQCVTVSPILTGRRSAGRYAMIDLMRRTYNVRELCDVLEVSRSAYARVVIDDLQKSHNRTAPGNRRKQSAIYSL